MVKSLLVYISDELKQKIEEEKARTGIKIKELVPEILGGYFNSKGREQNEKVC